MCRHSEEGMLCQKLSSNKEKNRDNEELQEGKLVHSEYGSGKRAQHCVHQRQRKVTMVNSGLWHGRQRRGEDFDTLVFHQGLLILPYLYSGICLEYSWFTIHFLCMFSVSVKTRPQAERYWAHKYGKQLGLPFAVFLSGLYKPSHPKTGAKRGSHNSLGGVDKTHQGS